MATRQYIGARYVPRFFENTSGTSDWRANTQYEPLTIVTRNGNSYTSKIPVPANIGAPENNPEYWVSTGIYNAQVQQLQENIDALQTESRAADEALDARVDVLEQGTALKRRYILIGDSYGRGVVGAGSSNVNGWTYYFKSMLGLSADDCVIACADGAGFIGLQSTTFTDLISNANATDPNTITDIVVAGGRNDINGSLPTIRTAMQGFINAARRNYPNARLWLCFCGSYRQRTDDAIDKLGNVESWYAKVMQFRRIPQAASFLNFYATAWGGTDTTHFNEEGYTALGQWIAAAVTGGSPELIDDYSYYALTAASGITFGTANINGRIAGDMFRWQVGSSFSISIDQSTAGNITGGNPYLLGDVADPLLGGYTQYSCSWRTNCNLRLSTGFVNGECTISIKNSQLYITIWNGNPNGSGFLDLSTLYNISIQPGLYEIPIRNIIG